jgi:DNA-binding response OmpR family regulator
MRSPGFWERRGARYTSSVSTVLIVQSDPTLNDGWTLTLEASGHTVLAARATTDGIERVREGGIDVIVVDTEDGGDSLTEFVAELDRLPDAPPFVLVSASPQVPQISARLGAAGFLPKPCDGAEVEQLVKRLIPRVSHDVDDEPTQPHGREF